MLVRINIIITFVVFGLLVCNSVYSQGLLKDNQAQTQLYKDSNVQPVTFIGAMACQQCHDSEYQQWKQSDHYNSMQAATDEFVLGDFSDVSVNFHNIKSRLYKKENRFFIDTQDSSSIVKTFPIKYTFGVYPLQQYLVEKNNGHIQALNIAWDSRKASEGGQRWFHLRPKENITVEHPFFWDKHFQNWNSRCADCHSTNVKKSYDVDSHSYNTTWSEINVACEACHGPASKHVELAQVNKITKHDTGFSHTQEKPLEWMFKPEHSIASSQGDHSDNLINMCAKCHSLRTKLAEKTQGREFLDVYRLQLLDDGSYFMDGQIREEVFVVGSFLQSKMYQKGVTCNNCHNPHSGKLLMEGNAVCAQCHQSTTFDTPLHHHHKMATPGAACVNCHMPEHTYMQVDDRRDHSFTIPRPDLTRDLAVPNACVQCHKKNDVVKVNDWANKVMSEWGMTAKDKHWAYLNKRTSQGDVMATPSVLSAVNNPVLPDIVKATLLEKLSAFPSTMSVDVAKQKLKDKNPLIRLAAVRALESLPPEYRWQLLSPYLRDNSLMVRNQIASTLADVVRQLPAEYRVTLNEIIRQYRESLAVFLESPATQVSIANLEMKLGNTIAVEKAYLQALRVAPNYVPALINLADFYRSIGKDDDAEAYLNKALKTAPDSSAVQHSYGLHLIRHKNYVEALPYLALATQQNGALARYSYVYAVALDHLAQTDKAISVLSSANEQWPNHYDILSTLVLYIDKLGVSAGTKQWSNVRELLLSLKNITPNAAIVNQLMKKYGYEGSE